MVPQHNPLRKSLAYSAAVIGAAALGAVVLYFATGLVLYLWNDTSWRTDLIAHVFPKHQS
jgi:hypothetical protein